MTAFAVFLSFLLISSTVYHFLQEVAMFLVPTVSQRPPSSAVLCREVRWAAGWLCGQKAARNPGGSREKTTHIPALLCDCAESPDFSGAPFSVVPVPMRSE